MILNVQLVVRTASCSPMAVLRTTNTALPSSAQNRALLLQLLLVVPGQFFTTFFVQLVCTEQCFRVTFEDAL